MNITIFLLKTLTEFITMIKSILVASIAILSVGVSKVSAEEVCGNIIGFQGVCFYDSPEKVVDYYVVPLPNKNGHGSVNCYTGDYTWNDALGKASAEAISEAWCGL